MLVAHLRFHVAPQNREESLEALTSGADAVRAMKGCVLFMPFLDPVDETALGVVHEWQSEADFAVYSASDEFRLFANVIRPMMTKAPESKRFRAELINVVN